MSKDLLWRPSATAEVSRYGLAAVAVLTLGVATAMALAGRSDGEIAASEVEDAVLLDLPSALPSSAPPSDATEGLEQQAMEAATPVAPAEETSPDEPPEPLQATAPAAPLEAPRPVAADPPPVAAAASQEAMAPAGSQTPIAAAEPIESEAASRHAGRAISLWQRAMLTRLERAKSGTHAGGLSGTVQIAFTIDRGGRLLASRIARSSGSARLDQIALTLLSHAAPFPAPPPGVAEAALAFTVPIAFAHAR